MKTEATDDLVTFYECPCCGRYHAEGERCDKREVATLPGFGRVIGSDCENPMRRPEL